MSKIVATIKKADLPNQNMEDEIHRKFMIEFVVGIKSIFAKYMVANYDINYHNAMTITHISEFPDLFEVGLESPELYSGKAREIVTNIMKNDLGSITEKIKPLNIMKKVCDTLTSDIIIMWAGFLLNRGGGDYINEQ